MMPFSTRSPFARRADVGLTVMPRHNRPFGFAAAADAQAVITQRYVGQQDSPAAVAHAFEGVVAHLGKILRHRWFAAKHAPLHQLIVKLRASSWGANLEKHLLEFLVADGKIQQPLLPGRHIQLIGILAVFSGSDVSTPMALMILSLFSKAP